MFEWIDPLAAREEVPHALRARADWLRSEYLKGGDYEHLSAREKECRHLADKLERGQLP